MGKEIPPPLELECLKALWRLERGSVKDVRAALADSRKLAYTTVMTLLHRLNQRGVVSREKLGRRFVYVPSVSREELQRQAVDALVSNFFDGQPGELLEYLSGARVESRHLSAADASDGMNGNGMDTVLL